MRPHESESYSLLAKQLFVWPYPYNKLSFLAFLINFDSVLSIGHFPSNNIIMILITGVITSVVNI